MFSGIIETTGIVKSIEDKQGDKRFIIDVNNLDLEELKLGDSISINGVCLTAITIDDKNIAFDVSNETLACSNLGFLKQADSVNLERALKLSDRVNGHIVTGHIDTVAEIVSKQADARSWRYEINIDQQYLKYICAKGSVCIDGVSLTVNAVNSTSFSINIIPHTNEKTLFNSYDIGSKVNVEVDMMARYIESLIQKEI